MLLPLKILAPFPALVPRCRSFAAATIFSLSSLSLSPPSPMEDTSAPSPIAAASADGGVDAEFGFSRPEMGKVDLAGTVGLYERHVFLCYKSADVWPPNLEAEGLDSLPRLLSAGLAARKSDMKKRTRLTICEGEDGTESSNGDVLIFPDMIRYRQLTHSDVDNFVEEVLVKDTEWLPGAVETLTGSHVFVCAHGSRDRRCGVCGPVLIEKFKEEINSHGLQGQVFVSPCSHIGGHKYAGNVIIFSPNISGKVSGHWYGYVTPTDVPKLLEQHIGKGEIIEHLWRGEMGLSAEDQKELHALRSKTLQATETNGFTNSTTNGGGGCCQGVGNSSCCQNTVVKEKGDEPEITEKDKANEPEFSEDNKGVRARKLCGMPTWFESWERENTYVTLAVVAAAASVAVAYSCYKQMK